MPTGYGLLIGLGPGDIYDMTWALLRINDLKEERQLSSDIFFDACPEECCPYPGLATQDRASVMFTW